MLEPNMDAQKVEKDHARSEISFQSIPDPIFGVPHLGFQSGTRCKPSGYTIMIRQPEAWPFEEVVAPIQFP